MLFQKFAGTDVFDIELDETDPDKLVAIIAALEPTFGAIKPVWRLLGTAQPM